MGTTVYPVDAVSGAPLYSGRKLRQAMAPLLVGATSARPLGARSGIRHGSGTVVAATSTTWTVTPHAGILDLEASASAGPYGYAVDDSSNTGSVAAADGTNPRMDIVWAQLSDPAEGDGSSVPSVTFGYTAGTAAASPAAPAAPARSMVLATITVPKAGGGAPTVAMVAPMLPTFTIPVRTQAERDAIPSPANGTMVLRLDTGDVQRWNGSAWVSTVNTPAASTPVLFGSGTNPNLGSTGVAERRYLRAGKLATVTYRFDFGGSGVAAGSGYYEVELPSTPQNTLNVTATGYAVDSSAFVRKQLGVSFVGSGRYRLLTEASPSGFVTDALPWVWATGDRIVLTVTYEEA